MKKRKIYNTKNNTRPCTLENIHSGRVIVGKSIAEFRREANLPKHAQLHITPILDGKRLSYMNWFLPSFLHQRISIKDVYGNVYRDVEAKEILVRKIISPFGIRALLNGSKKTFQNIALAETDIRQKMQPRSYKIKKLSFKDGDEIVEGESISEVAGKLGKNPSTLYSLLYGFKNKLCDITLNKVVLEQKQALDKLEIESTHTNQHNLN